MNNERTACANKPVTTSVHLARGIMQRKCACGQHAQASGTCKACSNDKADKTLQGKIQIGGINDGYEQEADRVADHIVRMPEPYIRDNGNQLSNHRPAPVVQRRATGDRSDKYPDAPPAVHDVLRTPGQPLDQVTRDYMEPRFGHDFSHVRIHTDPGAASSARLLNAHAYTVGNDIVFNTSKYRPDTHENRHLLAHELTHVIQQSGHLQRDFAVEPTTAAIDADQLNEQQIREAIRYNSLRYFDAAEIELLRDVLGLSSTPAVIDRAFVLAVASYQQQFGESIDGKLGRDSAAAMTRELRAERAVATTPELTTGARELGIRSRATQSVRNVDSGGKNDIFDAELDHANARLTLNMRVQFNFVAGAAGAWPNAAAQNTWRDSFIRLVQSRWSYKLLMRRRGTSNLYLKNYATRVRVTSSSASPHYTANVSFETAHTTSSVSGGANTATFDTLDVNPISYTFGAHTYRRTTAGHEFGHMLGLDHIACNNNSAACYGTNNRDRRNIMGYGGAVTTRNATPFLDAMRAITGMAWDARPLRRLV